MKLLSFLGNAISYPLVTLKKIFAFKFVRFVLIGGTGVLLNLLTTWIFTEFVFGLSLYYIGYILGLIVNLTYNFILHTSLTFKTKQNHGSRLVYFMTYSLLMTFGQFLVVRGIVSVLGEKWYLFIIGSIIFTFSIVTFFIMKLWLFKE